ncbi:secreted RxLR effector protein 161-like [Nicotiana tomentosiformis]|uniref:secreted RxLR effector protein 161-like n=1 Tax=Nicotiana tomentosiformis TaxID=4098 RepID=UPI00388C8F3D
MSPKDETEQEYMSRVSYANAIGSLRYAMEDNRSVVGYCDSGKEYLARRSTTGYVFTFAKAPVSWKSTLQSTVTLSTIEAEYMTIKEAVKEAIWLQGLLKELVVCSMLFEFDLVQNQYGGIDVVKI